MPSETSFTSGILCLLDSQKYDPSYLPPFDTFLFYPVSPLLGSHYVPPLSFLQSSLRTGTGTQKPVGSVLRILAEVPFQSVRKDLYDEEFKEIKLSESYDATG